MPLRLDPNTAWTVETSIHVGSELDGVLEYLEDPTPGIDGMAVVAREVFMPLATNMCVVGFEDIPRPWRSRRSASYSPITTTGAGYEKVHDLAAICATFDLGLSMHSNSHLGISLAAMTHVAAAVPNLTYALDTHWPWKSEDVIVEGTLDFKDGAVAVPSGPVSASNSTATHSRVSTSSTSSAGSPSVTTPLQPILIPSFGATLPRW